MTEWRELTGAKVVPEGSWLVLVPGKLYHIFIGHVFFRWRQGLSDLLVCVYHFYGVYIGCRNVPFVCVCGGEDVIYYNAKIFVSIRLISSAIC